MKKFLSTLLVTFFLGLFVCPALKDSQCSAQIRYYISKAYYDKDGVKHKHNSAIYYTFINNGTRVYESDRNGNSKNHDFKYIGEKDGLLIYRAFSPGIGQIPDILMDIYLYFTPDFKRLNWYGGYTGITIVYEQGKPGDEIQTPTKFY